MVTSKIRYGMISTEIRRDLLAPLTTYDGVEFVHFYRRASSDLEPHEFSGPNFVQYSNPFELLKSLTKMNLHAVQSVEPFAVVSLPYLLALRWVLRTNHIPLVTVSLENVSISTKYGRVAASVMRQIIRPILRRSSLIIAVNDGARRNFVQNGAPAERIIKDLYGCWGVDLQEFHPDGDAKQLRKCSSEVVLLFIGRLVKAKGIFDLIEAVQLVRNRHDVPLRLVVVGDGTDRKALISHVIRMNLTDSVDFVGPVPNREVPSYLRGSNILVVPSKTTRMWAEQVGMVFLQSMACGVPIITTRSGSIPEFVPDERAGLMVTEGDIEDLAHRILELSLCPELRSRLAHQARIIAEQQFDAQKNIERVMSRVKLAVNPRTTSKQLGISCADVGESSND